MTVEIEGIETAILLDALFMDDKELPKEELQKRISILEHIGGE